MKPFFKTILLALGIKYPMVSGYLKHSWSENNFELFRKLQVLKQKLKKKFGPAPSTLLENIHIKAGKRFIKLFLI